MTTTMRFAALFLSAGLTAGLVANLMLFQPKTVGADKRIAQSSRAPVAATARAGGSVVAAKLPEAVQPVRAPGQDVMSAARAIEITRSVQVALKTKGYSPGPADGVPGLMTRAAMMAFEYDNGLDLSGDVTSKRLEMLVYGVPANLQHRSARESLDVGPIAKDVIRTVQGSLKTAGYNIGIVDGGLSLRTARAIAEFEADQGLSETGRISGLLMAKLVSLASQGKLALQN
ncbi:MAG: peptidoglycan-binding protein [Pseudomonadota bacterium]